MLATRRRQRASSVWRRGCSQSPPGDIVAPFRPMGCERIAREEQSHAVRPVVQAHDFVSGLRSLGLRRGDGVVVHSSLKSLGWVEGGAETVIDALLEVVGPEGLLVVPTFTYKPTGFRPHLDPSQTGLVTERLRLRPNAIRSLHPTHSVAAIGTRAQELVKDHHLRPGLGLDSPLDRLAEWGGYVLLIGVDHTTSSTVHVGEAHAQAPYLNGCRWPGWPESAPVYLPNGDVLAGELAESPGCSLGFQVVGEWLARQGKSVVGKIGQARCELATGSSIIEAVVSLLRDDPAAVLCHRRECDRCRTSREAIATSRNR